MVKSWPIYNKVLGWKSRSSKTANITALTTLPVKSSGNWWICTLLVLLKWPFIMW